MYQSIRMSSGSSGVSSTGFRRATAAAESSASASTSRRSSASSASSASAASSPSLAPPRRPLRFGRCRSTSRFGRLLLAPGSLAVGLRSSPPLRARYRRCGCSPHRRPQRIARHRSSYVASCQVSSAYASQTSSRSTAVEDFKHPASAPQSYANNKTARKKMTRITTSEARNNSPRDGHDTLFISPSTEIKKSANAGICTTRKLAHNPIANNTSGTKYLTQLRRRPSDVAACHPSTRSSSKHPSATINAKAANVACRAIRPWFRLYRPKRNSS